MNIDNRRYIILGVILIFAVVFAIRLFYIQILDDTYKTAANSNSLQRIIDYPYRGLIYDRKGKIMVYNVPVFDIQVIPREVDKKLDTARLAKLFEIPRAELDTLLIRAKRYSRVKPTAIIKQMSHQDMASLQDQLVDFPGFYIIPRTVRGYPHQSMANSLGYIGEINKKQLDKSAGYYRSGDYIGLSGLEKHYEPFLRGRRGVKYIMVDVHGIQKGSFKQGAYDTISVKGENLHTSIDLDLQAYGEKLMTNKAGSIVAIEPSTGEILAFVSSPSYDPNMLTGREYSKNFGKLLKDSLKPLFNRAVMAMYRPGSTFKTVQALIGLQEGVIDSNTRYPCNKSLVKCHNHPSPCNVPEAVQHSCNPYFYQVFKRNINQGLDPRNTFKDTYLGYNRWRKYVSSLGIGSTLGIDLPNEKKGILPTTKFYDKWYGHYRWKFSTIYSLSIGEGEMGILPLQLANLACIEANRGWYITPHLVKKVGDSGSALPQYNVKHNTLIAPKHFSSIVHGMEMAVAGGTVGANARMKDVVICGKTGTSQNPKGKDHSIFICFAPKDNPKIAVACFVEYAGFGGLVAAPIATLMIEKFLQDTITRKKIEAQMIAQDFIHRRLKLEDIKADSSRKAKIKADSSQFLQNVTPVQPEEPIEPQTWKTPKYAEPTKKEDESKFPIEKIWAIIPESKETWQN
jgi:penicillin-binding protein 2